MLQLSSNFFNREKNHPLTLEEIASYLILDGTYSVEKIAEITDLPLETVQKIQAYHKLEDLTDPDLDLMEERFWIKETLIPKPETVAKACELLFESLNLSGREFDWERIEQFSGLAVAYLKKYEAIKLIQEGLDNQEIENSLDIAEHRIDNYRVELEEKQLARKESEKEYE